MIHFHSGTLTQGEITTIDSVRLDGRLEGRICCSRLEIGPDGYLVGNAEVEELVIEGQVVGTVSARVVDIRPSALVEGDVHHERLEVAEAAVLVGRSLRLLAYRPPQLLLQMRERARKEAEEIDAIERESMLALAIESDRARPAHRALRTRLFS
jgi:cytoskeletal protein CcmA (bactofilin family)